MSASSVTDDVVPTAGQAEAPASVENPPLIDPLLCRLILDLASRSLAAADRRDAVKKWFLSLLNASERDYGTCENLKQILSAYSNRKYKAGTEELWTSITSMETLRLRSAEKNNARASLPEAERKVTVHETKQLKGYKELIASAQNGKYAAVMCLAASSPSPCDMLTICERSAIVETAALALILAVVGKDIGRGDEVELCRIILRRAQKLFSNIIIKAALLAIADLSINAQDDVLVNAALLVPVQDAPIRSPSGSLLANNIFGWKVVPVSEVPSCLVLDAALSVFHELGRERLFQKDTLDMIYRQQGVKRDWSNRSGWLLHAVEFSCTTVQIWGIAAYRCAAYAISCAASGGHRYNRFRDALKTEIDERQTETLERLGLTSNEMTFPELEKDIEMSQQTELENTGGFLRGLTKHGVAIIAERGDGIGFVRATFFGRPACLSSRELCDLFSRLKNIEHTAAGGRVRASAKTMVAVWAYIALSITVALCVFGLNPAGRETALERVTDLIWVVSTMLISVFGLVKLVSEDPNAISHALAGRKALLTPEDVAAYLDILDLDERTAEFSLLKAALAACPVRLPWLNAFEVSFVREEPSGALRLKGGVHPRVLSAAGVFVTDEFAFDVLNGDVRRVLDIGDGLVRIDRERDRRVVSISEIMMLSEKMVV